MISSLNNFELYNRLQKLLEGLLKEQNPELTIWDGNDYPLLILETSRDSIGFAVIKDIPEISFSSAYNSFKQLYRQKHSTWKKRNLSFVVCRSESKSTHDAFFSSIETDIYFCRKYVIYLHIDQDDIKRELRRLPFLPLPQEHTSGVFRPPPAQTLLQHLNVTAPLARHIVVPRQLSANRIISNLLAQKEPPPTIHTISKLDTQPQVQPTEHTRIKNVTIEAFRAYKKKQEFDVDADVVIFYGPNGLGKTSFFDAIDYVCTGRIGRLCRQRINQQDFVNIARHLGSSANDGYVSMQISHGTEDYSIKRSIDNWSTALIGREKKDRASTLQFLTSARWGSEKVRIENLERLFRATHLFSQTDPELLAEFEQGSTLSQDLVSHMLALDDYASGVAKATAVVTQLDKQIQQSKRQVSVLKNQTAEVESQIEALPEPQDTVQAGEQLRKMATSLTSDLKVATGMTIDNTEPSQAATREWRAMVESILKGAIDRLHQLQSIESNFSLFTKNSSELKLTTAELSRLEVVHSDQTTEHQCQQEVIKKLTDRVEHARGIFAQTNSRLRSLTELNNLQEVFQKNNSSLQQWQQELKSVVCKVEVTTSELHQLLPIADNLLTQSSELRELIQVKSQNIKMLSKILDGLPSLEKNRVHITDLQQKTVNAQSVIQSYNNTINKLKTCIAAKEMSLSAFELEYDALMTNQLELTRLLDEIETHVCNGICPTCGINHKSKTILIERIHAQKQNRPAHVEALVKRLSELKSSLKQDRVDLTARITEQTSKNNELKEMADKLSELSESVEVFERIVKDAGFQMSLQLPSTVTCKLAEEKIAHKSSQEILKNLESESTNTIRLIKGLEQKQHQLAENRKRAEDAIELLEQHNAASHTKAETLGLSLDMAPNKLTAEIETAVSCKAATEIRIGELETQIEMLTRTTNEMERQINETINKIESLRKDNVRLNNKLERYKEKAATVINHKTLALDVINEQKRLTAESVDHLEALRKRCFNIERAVDATQRSVMFAELEAKAQSLTEEKQILDEEIKRMSAIKKWTANVKDVLDRQSSSAVANHVDALGPLTTLIQKRLRSVYGFGDVNLFAKGNEICVKVGWKNEYVKPADYFSDSQKQILMLSLFFAGRLTQLWSGFTPILMDDPVTHFDDLNAFGFVELIRGFVDTSPGKQQFFISTCEERLFELMRKKFRGVAGGAKFYRFAGVGHDGPIIKEQSV